MLDKRIKWSVKTVDISLLKPYAKNPRIITQIGIDKLKKSLNDCGYAQFINVNTDYTILSGHARFEALKQEGATQVEVLFPDRTLTPKQEESMIIQMNKAISGTFDFDILANEFEIDDLLEWGFSADELMKLDEVEKKEETKEVDFDFDYKIEVDCLNEDQQKYLTGELNDRGFKVRVLL